MHARKQTGAHACMKLGSWVAHELEAWIAGWDAFQPHVLYTGADDAVLKVCVCMCVCVCVRVSGGEGEG